MAMAATLESRLPEIVAELRPRVSAAVKAGAEAIASEAKARVPVLTGALRDSIEVRRHSATTYRVVGAQSGTFWGSFVEYGTEYMEAKPYLLPSAEDQEEAIAAGVAAVLETL